MPEILFLDFETASALPGEIWKPIRGDEGRYEVSNLGRVKSVQRFVPSRVGKRIVRERILRPGRQQSGHLIVVLSPKTGARCVHRLVLEAFVGERPLGMEACHNNGDPGDNRLANLRWDTRGNNIRDLKWHGKARGLSVEEVKSIKHQLSSGATTKFLAEKFAVCRSTIERIKNGRMHADV